MGSAAEDERRGEAQGERRPSAATPGPGETFFRTVDDPSERAVTADDERDRLAETDATDHAGGGAGVEGEQA